MKKTDIVVYFSIEHAEEDDPANIVKYLLDDGFFQDGINDNLTEGKVISAVSRVDDHEE